VVSARTFQFPRFAAEQAAQLADAHGGPFGLRRSSGRPWGWLFLLALAIGSGCLLGVYLDWTAVESTQHDTGTWLILGGLGLLSLGAVALCLWVWRVLRAPNRPWGRLMLLGLLVVYLGEGPAQSQLALPWTPPLLNALGWALFIGLVLRVLWLGRHGRTRVASTRWADGDYATAATVDDEAARWAAGAAGERVVAEALARLGGDHVVINNLPLARRGDADHVVVGPAGAVVIETKYLSGQIICEAEDVWIQVKRDEERLIASPAAQVQRVADGVADLLASSGMSDVPVFAVLVMAHPRAVLEVEQSPVLVVRPAELVPRLRHLAREQPRLNGASVAAAANALLGAGTGTPVRNGQVQRWR
jgi:Nuclease-related domain